MLVRARWFFVLTLLVAGSSGCLLIGDFDDEAGEGGASDDDGGAGGGSGGAGPQPDELPSTYRELVERVAGLLCRKQADCCPAGDAEYVTVASCEEASVAALLGFGGFDVEAGLAAGTVRYNDVSALGCLQSLEEAACTSGQLLSTFLRGCQRVLEGQLAPGEACEADAQCRCDSDLACAFARRCDGPEGGAKVCRAVGVRAEGESCERSLDCADGLLCDFFPSGAGAAVCGRELREGDSCSDQCFDWQLDCVNGVCIPAERIEIGGSCAGELGYACKASFCAPDTERCTAPKPDGAACSDEPYECEGACREGVCQNDWCRLPL